MAPIRVIMERSMKIKRWEVLLPIILHMITLKDILLKTGVLLIQDINNTHMAEDFRHEDLRWILTIREVNHLHMADLRVEEEEVTHMDLQGENSTVQETTDLAEVPEETLIMEMISCRTEAEVSINKERKILEKDNHVAVVVVTPMTHITNCAFKFDEL